MGKEGIQFHSMVALPYLTRSVASSQGQNIALVSRIMIFLLKIHHHQIVAQRAMRTSLLPLRKYLRDALMRQKEMVGYNLAALRYLQKQQEASHTASFMENNIADLDKLQEYVVGDSKKRKRVTIKA
jgi:U3 small nucleolar RNA-associated protein 12